MKIITNAILQAPTIQRISLNERQRVFVVGDLDADLNRFKKAMIQAGFDAKEDQLVCLGDVIDRGKDSLAVLEYLRELNSILVLGNHEHLMIESILGGNEDAKTLWNKNGGSWHKGVSESLLRSHCHFLLKQPLSLVIEYQKYKIGISHTLPLSWDWDHLPDDKAKIVSDLLWSRELFKKEKCLANHGVDFSVHGHNSTQIPFWINNTYHMDTSYYGRPTVLELNTIIRSFDENMSSRP